MTPPKSAEFVIEAKEHLSEICHQLLQLERPSPEGASARMEAILRSVHSMKGGAGYFGFRKLEQLLHTMETALESLLGQTSQLESPTIDIFLEAIDRATAFVDDVDHGDNVDTSGILIRLEELGRLPRGAAINEANREPEIAPATSDSTPSDRPDLKDGIDGRCRFVVAINLTACHGLGVSPLDVVDRVLRVGEIESGRICQPEIDLTCSTPTGPIVWETKVASRLRPSEFRERVDLPLEIDADQTVVTTEATTQSPERRSQADVKAMPETRVADRPHSLRVPLALANRLVNLAGELVLVRNQARSFAERRQALPASVVQRFENVTSDFQSTVLQTRMQPVSTLFQRFPRLVRDLGRQLGKQIQLVIDGSEVEVDKSILDALSDPLTHLIRNACDHGLESPEIRVASGKPAAGHIRLSARHVGDQICIEVTDDGRGIDREAITRKASAQGLGTPEDLARMPDRDLLAVILLPGFSTASSVTDLSGRGVGMDVVRANVYQLGGSVEIRSEASRGTTFVLRLPLTLAIIPSLLVELSGQRFAIPQRDLDRLVRIDAAESAVRIEWTKDQEMLRLRGRLLPLVRWPLHSLTSSETGRVSAAASARTEASPLIVVLKAGTRKFGLVVDRVLNSEEIVVKPMHGQLRWLEMYSGATILGDGGIALILNAEGLVQAGQVRFTMDSEFTSEEAPPHTERQLDLLLVQLLHGERAAVPIRDLRRVVLTTRDACQRVAQNWYFQHERETLRLGWLELGNRNHGLPDAPHRLFVLISRSDPRLGCIVQRVFGSRTVPESELQRLPHEPGLLGAVALAEGITPVVELSRSMAGIRHDDLAEIAPADRRILIVDDTEFFRSLVAKCLRDEGYKVTTTEDGAQALEILQRASFDLVVSDLEMPVLDGLKLAEHIRQNERLRGLPLLALTTLTGPDIEEKARQHGFDALEIKFDQTSFLDRVRRLFEESEKTRVAEGTICG